MSEGRATWGEIRSTSATLRGIEAWLALLILGLAGIGLVVSGVSEGQVPWVVSGALLITAGVLGRRAVRAFRTRGDAIAHLDQPSFTVNRPRDYLPEIRALLLALGAVAGAVVIMAVTS